MKKPLPGESRVPGRSIYTRQGDGGQSRLADGRAVAKDSLRLECNGTLDELNAAVGLARTTAEELAGRVSGLAEMAAILARVQHELFNLGSLLAVPGRKELAPGTPSISGKDVERLEREIDEASARLPPLRAFVLPGGNRLNAELHLCRTVCRRAERRAVTLSKEETVPPGVLPYLNRLSDAFFAWSRWASRLLGTQERWWEPKRPSAGRKPTG